MKRKDICKSILKSVSNIISSPEFLDAHRQKNRFVRQRLLSMQQVILYLMYSSKASMAQNIASIRKHLPALSFPNVSKQALSKARQAISPALFKEFYNISVDLFYQNLSSRKTWNGYHIYAIDGSKLELPNSPSNFEEYGEMFTYPRPDRKFTSCMVSILYDVLEDYITHASIQPYLASERAAAVEHLRNLQSLGLFQNSVVIFDRGYYSEKMFRHCVENQQLCVMRLQEKFKIAQECLCDLYTWLPSDPKKNNGDVLVRVIEVPLPNGTKEYLATNLFDPSITVEMFRDLYFLRWPVELKYFELKNYLLIEEFNGATATSIQQEFYLNLFLSNLVSLIKNHVDYLIGTKQSDSVNKHRYQANRSFIIGQMKDYLPSFVFHSKTLKDLDDIVKQACRCKSQIQPGRHSPRRNKKKTLGRTHFRNRKTSF